MTEPSLIYVADPMCSWCYAFTPELDTILERSGLALRFVAGGLFVGDRRLPLDDELRKYLFETWSRVGALSGMPISFELLDWPSWTYDTEYACRALVAHRDLTVFKQLQHAFYADNRDLADPDTFDLYGATLGASIRDVAIAAETTADFATAADLGATGFPTLILDTGSEKITVSAGYNRADKVLRSIDLFAA